LDIGVTHLPYSLEVALAKATMESRTTSTFLDVTA